MSDTKSQENYILLSILHLSSEPVPKIVKCEVVFSYRSRKYPLFDELYSITNGEVALTYSEI